jgi:hypothetical protein
VLAFAVKTAPNAAVLTFTFVLLVAILFSLLIWCAGDPKRMLPTVLLVAPIASLYISVVVGGVVALGGWPMVWLFEQIFALLPAAEARASSLLKINYLSIALVMGAAMVVVIELLIHGIWTEERRVRRQFVRGIENENGIGSGGENLGLVDVENSQGHQHSEGYRRVGVTVGSIFAILPIVVGLGFARTGLSVALLIYCGLAAVIMFFIPYLISRSLGWIVDNFISKMQAGTS